MFLFGVLLLCNRQRLNPAQGISQNKNANFLWNGMLPTKTLIISLKIYVTPHFLTGRLKCGVLHSTVVYCQGGEGGGGVPISVPISTKGAGTPTTRPETGLGESVS